MYNACFINFRYNNMLHSIIDCLNDRLISAKFSNFIIAQLLVIKLPSFELRLIWTTNTVTSSVASRMPTVSSTRGSSDCCFTIASNCLVSWAKSRPLADPTSSLQCAAASNIHRYVYKEALMMEWIMDWKIEWMMEWMLDGINDRINEEMNERRNEWWNGWTMEWMLYGMSDGMNNWIKDCMK